MATNKITIKPFDKDPSGQYIDKLSNHLFDYIMPSLSPTAWMVLCFIIRKTTGWKKDSDGLSIGEIKKGTGIKSDNTIIKAISELEEKKYILSDHQKDTRKKNTYGLNTTLKIEVETTSKNAVVNDKTTSKNAVETTSKNEVEEGLTTSKNEDSKEQSLNTNKKGQTPAQKDYLATIVNGIGNVTEATASNPDDQWFEYRDKALKAFPGDWGRTTEEREIKKNLITGFVANNPKFNPEHWSFVIQDSIAHGVSSNNIARFIEVYPFKNYDEYLASRYRAENGRDSPPKPQLKLVPVAQKRDEEDDN